MAEAEAMVTEARRRFPAPTGAPREVPVRQGGRGPDVGYVLNIYPRGTHTFIRREIAALEAQGVVVHRYSVRRSEEPLVDEADAQELGRTSIVLDLGTLRLLWLLLSAAFRFPGRLLGTLRLAIALGWRSDRGLLAHLAYVVEACALQHWIRRDQVTHLHAHFANHPTSLVMLVAKLSGIPYSFTVHGPTDFDNPRLIALSRKVAGARFVTAISDFCRSQLYRISKVEDWPKIEVVRCGVDESLLRSVHTPIGPAPRLVCVGRLAENKGHLILLEASARIRREGVVHEIVLVGDGPMRRTLERAIEGHELQDTVRLTGTLDGEGVKRELRASRALCLPSFAEGLPVVVMEAFALGRPVIATSVAGIPELVEPGVSGWLVPPASVDALARALRECLTAPPDVLEKMGSVGKVHVARRHDAAREAAALRALFDGRPAA